MFGTKYLDLILSSTGLLRTKKVLQVNPTAPPTRVEPEKSIITVFEYSKDEVLCKQLNKVEDAFPFLHSPSNTWINVDGLRKEDVDKLAAQFGIHPLIAEDIISIGQRPKTDEIDGLVFCLLNMLSFNKAMGIVESEQLSIILGRKFVITFQEDPTKDPFNPLRDKLKISSSKVRQLGSDFLFYSLLDYIVDYYFVVMENLAEKIEDLEEEIIKNANNRSLVKINMLRKEMIVLKRSIAPVRELVSSIMRSETELIEERTEKYFKDVYDHIIQAHDLSENYRDMMMNLQDLYLSNVNLRMNEVMKVMAVVTCLLAPATVIGGIFGMNFDIIPLMHNTWGFFICVGLMLIIPIVMLRLFKKRGWF
ncbi:magnesium/cobalt transporter CorA [Ferruginibacter yonginensis]|uniref:Magnesium transport protein CorA n=1 Tax=Ferruginibacter yonginensis TaxID=1310416 RepID=A0ABV8QTL7_9BACT